MTGTMPRQSSLPWSCYVFIVSAMMLVTMTMVTTRVEAGKVVPNGFKGNCPTNRYLRETMFEGGSYGCCFVVCERAITQRKRRLVTPKIVQMVVVILATY
jgi:hypothetical protein